MDFLDEKHGLLGRNQRPDRHGGPDGVDVRERVQAASRMFLRLGEALKLSIQANRATEEE